MLLSSINHTQRLTKSFSLSEKFTSNFLNISIFSSGDFIVSIKIHIYKEYLSNRIMKALIFCLLLVATAVSKPLNPKKILFAIDAGTDEPYESTLGFTYDGVSLSIG